MIDIKKLEFKYGNIDILKKIDLFLEEESFVGIIGPNGSGKSTLLKNISNVLHPDKGSVLIDNILLSKYRAKDLAKKIAVVPQNTNIGFNFNVYDIIMMGRNPYQDRWGRVTNKDEEMVKRAMALTDTYSLSEKNINELSGGERQRVIIARALAQDPEILLLDEPTSNLDINYQGEIYDILSYLNKELSITIIAVSHDLNLTAQYCEKLVLLDEGQIHSVGTAEEVLTEENIAEVYSTRVIIKNNPLSNKPYVTLIPHTYKKRDEKNNRDFKIHIIAGGGTGERYMELLWQKQYKLSAGVLNQGDADWQTARRLDIEIVEAPPFVDFRSKDIEANRNCLKNADLIVVTDVPFGRGNLANLKLVSEFVETPKVLFNTAPIQERDYTNGKATDLWNKILLHKNTLILQRKDNFLSVIKKVEK
ncbi:MULTISPECIES: ABC transporter ATP-binding protein [unclassified Halanaerobium]|uniref:ABC transporter ATP-binding protein n=1 Tax=unclassified Halanaerobium TaxID=2641197 RepID=UPI000DF339B5|nr:MULTISPECIES: ABC transporter ATP-binding protein [unclassified Halanaerobium]